MSDELTTLDAVLTGFMGGAALGLAYSVVRILADRYARLGLWTLLTRLRRPSR